MRLSGIKRFIDPDDSPLPLWGIYAFSAYYLIVFLIVAAGALSYPYILEWLEGAVMQTVERVAQGLPIYTRPTLAYTPFMYTPLYYYVAAAFTYLFGMDFAAGRLVSILSTLGIAGLCYAWMRREGADRALSILAGAMFLATNAAVGGWLHVARVDMLFMLLLLLGLFTYAQYRTAGSAILAGALFTLAFYTKQQALPVALMALLLSAPVWPRKALLTAAVFLVSSAALYLYYQYATDGWFRMYIYDMPVTLPKNFNNFFVFWRRHIFHVLPVMAALAAFGAWEMLRRDRGKGLFYLGMLAGAGGASLASFIHVLGWNNVFIPFYLALILIGMLFAAHAVSRGWIHRNLLYSILLLQMAMLWHTPHELIPTQRQQTLTEQYFNYIGQLPGEVFIPDLQFVQEQVGKNSYAYRMGAFDVMYADLGDRNYVKSDLRSELEEALRQQKFSAIILSDRNGLPMKNPYYTYKGTILNGRAAPFIRGAMQYPNFVFVPIQGAGSRP